MHLFIQKSGKHPTPHFKKSLITFQHFQQWTFFTIDPSTTEAAVGRQNFAKSITETPEKSSAYTCEKEFVLLVGKFAFVVF